MSAAHALLVVMLPVGACSSSTTAVPSSADASVDVPFATGPCRWSEGNMVLVAVTSAPEGRLELLDAVGTGDGAALAWRERDPARPSDVLRVRRLRDDASLHDWSAPGRGSLRPVALASMQLRSLDAARVVATRRGALVFMSFTQQFAGGGIMAVPMDCLP